MVEATPSYETPGQGMQQAKEYAEILDLKFAYATNGHGIVEFDYTGSATRMFADPEEITETDIAEPQPPPTPPVGPPLRLW